MSAIGYLSVETAKPSRGAGCSTRWKASVSAGAGPFSASDPGSLSLPSSTVQHSIYLNAETCLPSIWRCRLSDTFPSRPPNPVGVRVVPLAGKPRYRLARVRFRPLILVRFHSLHLAMSAIGYLSVETAKPSRGAGCSARWKASVSAGAGPFSASDPGSLSLPSSTVQHSIYLNAETCLPSIWRCRLADMSPSRSPTPVEMEIDGALICSFRVLRVRLIRSWDRDFILPG